MTTEVEALAEFLDADRRLRLFFMEDAQGFNTAGREFDPPHTDPSNPDPEKAALKFLRTHGRALLAERAALVADARRMREALTELDQHLSYFAEVGHIYEAGTLRDLRTIARAATQENR